MNTVSNIAQQLGRKNMADRLHVGTAAISNALAFGKFPAAWYLVVSEMAADEGIECPVCLFAFRSSE